MFSEMSIKEEYELGQKYNAIMKTQAPILYDPVFQTYLQEMVETLLKSAPPQNFKYEINMLISSDVNAFATAGGYLYVNTGLFLRMQTESELASVVAHEIAHVSQRHIAQSKKTSAVASMTAVLAAIGAALAGSQVDGNAATGLLAAGMGAAQSTVLSYSRDHENEADNVGFEYMKNSPYNANDYVNAFRKIQSQYSFGNATPSYLSTHPDIQSRISNIAARIHSQNLPQKEDGTKKFRNLQIFLRAQFDTIRNAKAVFSQLEQSEPNNPMLQLGYGILSTREQKIADARIHYDNLIKAAPNDALYLREAGNFHFQHGKIETALELLNKSFKLNPNDLMTRFFLARVQNELNNNTSAQNNYNAILKIYPLDSQVHGLLGHSYAKTKNEMLAFLHLAYSSLYRSEWNKAEQYFGRARTLARTESEQKLIKQYTDSAKFYRSVLRS